VSSGHPPCEGKSCFHLAAGSPSSSRPAEPIGAATAVVE
jgi:hypothetical protein